MTINECIEELNLGNGDWHMKSPSGLPVVEPSHRLPDDLVEFYKYYGGGDFFNNSPAFPVRILPPMEVIPSNIKITGKQYHYDMSSSWYVIADAGDGNFVSIDFDENRQGLCYESFEYSHAVAGSCPIISECFASFLTMLINYKGDYFFWKDQGFTPIGDAYE